jgi:cell division septal protein FtsQ
MKSQSQARPARRHYRRYETAATHSRRIQTIARPSFDALVYLSNPRVVAGLLLGVVVALAAWLGIDARFYVTRMSVTGTTRTPPLEIANNSGLVGLHIFWVNATEAEAQILRKTPSLKHAQVTCQLPAQCSIKVEERTPVVAWQYGEAITWVDADGMAFAAHNQPGDPQLITIEATQGPALASGRPADSKVIQAALSVARLLPDIKRFRYSGAHGLEFNDDRGFPVYLGLAEDMSDRVMIWKALRDNLSARNVQPKFVDIRYPLAPFYGE